MRALQRGCEGEQTKSNHHNATEASHCDKAMWGLSNLLSDSSSDQAPGAISDEGKDGESCAHKYQLRGDGSAISIDKLREDRSKEDKDLGVQGADPESVAR